MAERIVTHTISFSATIVIMIGLALFTAIGVGY